MRGATARSPSSGLSQPPWVPGGCGDSGLGPERPGDAAAAELADFGNKVGGLQVSSAGEKLRGFRLLDTQAQVGGDSVMAACPSEECVTHEWGVGVGTQGWTGILVDLM